MASTSTTPEIKLPGPLERWLRGSVVTAGTISPPSPTGRPGESLDRQPIVVSLTHKSGLKTYRTALATSSALKEENTGALILTHSWGLDRAAAIEQLNSYPSNGEAVEIESAITMMAGTESDTTSRSILSRIPISGPLAVNCDLCSRHIASGDPYITVVRPPHDQWIYHPMCVKGSVVI